MDRAGNADIAQYGRHGIGRLHHIFFPQQGTGTELVEFKIQWVRVTVTKVVI